MGLPPGLLMFHVEHFRMRRHAQREHLFGTTRRRAQAPRSAPWDLASANVTGCQGEPRLRYLPHRHPRVRAYLIKAYDVL